MTDPLVSSLTKLAAVVSPGKKRPGAGRPSRRELARQLVEAQASERRARTALAEANHQVARYEDALGGIDDSRLQSLRYLFVVAYGRSGSTLLQGVLNSIPGYDIHGENREALHSLFRYHSVLLAEKKRNTRAKVLAPQSSWYGIDRYASERAIQDMRGLVVRTLLRPEPEARVTGFKEIRWWREDWKDYFQFLRELFPNARFVMNTRAHEDVAKSKWWTNMEDPVGQLKGYEERMAEMAELLGNAAYHVHYDDYVANPDALRGLFDWLGEPFERRRIEDVLAKKHSY